MERFPGVVFNEALTMQLGAAVGLPAAKVETRSVEGTEYLLARDATETERIGGLMAKALSNACIRKISARHKTSSPK